MSTDQPVDSKTLEQTKQQIRDLVAEIAQLSKQDLDAEQYYAEFLQRVVNALAAVGGAVWTLNDSGQLELAYQINLRTTNLADTQEDQVKHGRLLQQMMVKGEGAVVPPFSGGEGEDEAGNPTRFLLVFAPIKNDDQVAGIVEVFQRPDSAPATQRGYLRFLLQMVELVGQWMAGRKLRQLGDRQSLWAKVDTFSQAVHDSLEPRQTAYTIANEGRVLIGCDRVSVAILRGSKCKVEAVSGQDLFDARSNVVSLLGRLASKVVAAGDPLWYSGKTEDLPPQIEGALEEYIDEAHTKTIAILPLRKPDIAGGTDEQVREEDAAHGDHQESPIIGALIVEQVDDTQSRQQLMQRIDLMYEHSARALVNSLDHNNLFLMPVWRELGRLSWIVRARTLPKTIAITIAVLIGLISLFVVPVDFDMKAKGTLEPVIKQDVFASQPGVVKSVMVKHGDLVDVGTVLFELENVDLEVDLNEISGKLQTKRKIHQSLRAALTSAANKDDAQLAGQLNEIDQEIESLEEQLLLFNSKMDELTVRSPTAGQIVTWDLDKRKRRPVAVGQVLLTVADPSGQWELELHMPENKMGHVLEMQQRMPDEQLQVSFIAATDPDSPHLGTISEIDTISQVHGEDGQSVAIRVDIDKDDLKTVPRPGATVTAKVKCGKSSIFRRYGHTAIEFLQGWFF